MPPFDVKIKLHYLNLFAQIMPKPNLTHAQFLRNAGAS